MSEFDFTTLTVNELVASSHRRAATASSTMETLNRAMEFKRNARTHKLGAEALGVADALIAIGGKTMTDTHAWHKALCAHLNLDPARWPTDSEIEAAFAKRREAPTPRQGKGGKNV